MKLNDISSIGRAFQRIIDTITPKPVAPAAEAPGDTSTFDASPRPAQESLTGMREGAAGRTAFDHPVAAENAVARNRARERPWTMEQIRANPNGFLENVVQIDGIRGTDVDRVSCGPTSMLMGMLAARPDSVRELGARLIDERGQPTEAGRRLLGSNIDAPVVQSALRNIRSGTFSARDVTYLGECLQSGGGSTATQLIALRASITQLGISVPRMELQQFGHPDGSQGHWRVAVNGSQYNPWPDARGRSERIDGPGGLRDGAADGDGWLCREKLYLGDDMAVHNVYSIAFTGGHEAVQNDPPLFIVRHERQPDGSFHRADVDATRMRQLRPLLNQHDIDNTFERNIPPR